MIRESLDQAPGGSQADPDLALPRVALTPKALTKDQVTYPSGPIACAGPDIVEAVGKIEVNGNMADFAVSRMAGRWASRDDGHDKSARQQPLDDDQAETSGASHYDRVLSAH
jgi:hypothetical protein